VTDRSRFAQSGLEQPSRKIAFALRQRETKGSYSAVAIGDGGSTGGQSLSLESRFSLYLGLLVSCLGDFVSANVVFGIRVSPTKWFGRFGVRTNVFA
jgi:hypothetical protein